MKRCRETTELFSKILVCNCSIFVYYVNHCLKGCHRHFGLKNTFPKTADINLAIIDCFELSLSLTKMFDRA